MVVLYLIIYFQFNWIRYLSEVFQQVNLTFNASEEIVVYAPEYLSNMVDLITNTSNRYTEYDHYSKQMEHLAACIIQSIRMLVSWSTAVLASPFQRALLKALPDNIPASAVLQ